MQTMPTPKDIRSTVHSYIDMMCRSDIDGIMALYADDATDIFCFDDDGKITSMRAYWNPAELRVERYASC